MGVRALHSEPSHKTKMLDLARRPGVKVVTADQFPSQIVNVTGSTVLFVPLILPHFGQRPDDEINHVPGTRFGYRGQQTTHSQILVHRQRTGALRQ